MLLLLVLIVTTQLAAAWIDLSVPALSSFDPGFNVSLKRQNTCPSDTPLLCPGWNRCHSTSTVCCDLTQGTSTCDVGYHCFMYYSSVRCCPDGENCDPTATTTNVQWITETITSTSTIVITGIATSVAPNSSSRSNPMTVGAAAVASDAGRTARLGCVGVIAAAVGVIATVW